LLHPLLGHTVVAVNHAALIGRYDHESTDHLYLCTSSLVFTLDDGQRWELLAAQQSDVQALVFKGIQDDSDLLTAMDMTRAPEEQATIAPSTVSDQAPWHVAGITEVWTSLDMAVPFLHGLALWGPPAPYDYTQRTLLLGVYVAGDDLEFATSEHWWSLLLGNHFFLGRSLYHFYAEES